MWSNARTTSMPHGAVCLALVLLVAACGRPAEDTTPPPAEVALPAQTPPPHETTVVGCLRAGDADGTFVLTASEEGLPLDARTYHLVGAPVRQDPDRFRQHIGHTVSVRGLVVAPDEGAMVTRTRTPADEQDEDVQETAIVETQTDVQIRELQVQEMQHVSDRCEQ